MATPQGPTYEDYIACVPPANRHKLQQELDCESGDGVDLHLGELAHLLVDWELLAPKLGLSDVDISDVHSDNCRSAELQRVDALKRSKSTLGFNATYGTYLKIFVENHKAKGALKCAEKIVMQLGATGGPSQSRSHAAQSTPSPLTQAQSSPPHSSPLSPPPSLQYTPYPSLQYTPHPSLQYSPPLSLPYTHNGGPHPSPYSSLPTSPPYNGHTSSGYNSNGSAVAPLAGTGANVGWATGHAQSRGMPPAPDADSTTILDYDDDFHEVHSYLRDEQAKCYEIGSALKVKQGSLEKIEQECPSDLDKALRRIIAEWLKCNYNVKKHGRPTWKVLADAVKTGGNNTVLAERIAKDHPQATQPSEGNSQAQLPAHSAVSNSPQVTQRTTQVTGNIVQADEANGLLTIDDKNTVLPELASVASKWEDLGLALDLKQDQLDIINSDRGGCSAKLGATVSAWLRGEGGERSWKFLCAALRSPLVARRAFADILEKKHSL